MNFLVEALMLITWKEIVMWAIGFLLIFLAIKFKMEPTLLLPIGFGCILVNIPLTNVLTQNGNNGIIEWLFHVGIEISEAMPILLFIGIGAMVDFEPLISNPKLMFVGAFAQIGIFITLILAACFGFNIQDAASIAIIGSADGPTSILVALSLKTQYLGPIMVAAYSYMALVPIIQPPVIKLLTTKKERLIRMDDQKTKKVSKPVKILFPIVTTIIAGLIAPSSLALVGFLMFGNLIKECGVLGTLTTAAKDTLAGLITLLLGITVAFTMQADKFLNTDTLLILFLGLFAFVVSTGGAILLIKFVNLFLKKKINPMLGAAGVSAFPMSARVVHKMGLKEDPTNYLLMPAVGINFSGQVASAIVGGLIIGLVAPLILI